MLKEPVKQSRFKFCAGVLAAFGIFTAGKMHAADKPPSIFLQALTCEVPDEELAQLPQTLARADRGMIASAQRFTLPVLTLYNTRIDVRAFGYTSRQIVLQPGRILMLVPATERAKVESMLELTRDRFKPSSKEAGPNRSIVAYELSSLPGQLLLGCQYQVPAASAWGAN